MKNITLAIVLLPMLLACGGGGGGSSSPASPGQPLSDTPDAVDDNSLPQGDDNAPSVSIDIVAQQPRGDNQSVPSNAVAVASSAEIDVPEGFVINGDQAYQLTLSHSYSGQGSYLSVCSDYQTNEGGELKINYSNCTLRTAIKGSDFEGSFTLGGDVESVAVAVWFLDTTIEPVIIDWPL